MDWISNLTDASSIKEDETNNMHATIFALKKQNEIKQKKTAIKSNYVFFLSSSKCVCVAQTKQKPSEIFGETIIIYNNTI